MSDTDPEQSEYPPWSCLHVGLKHSKNLALYAQRQAKVIDGIRVMVVQTVDYRDSVLTVVMERSDGGRVELNLNDGGNSELLAARIEAAAWTLMAQP